MYLDYYYLYVTPFIKRKSVMYIIPKNPIGQTAYEPKRCFVREPYFNADEKDQRFISDLEYLYSKDAQENVVAFSYILDPKIFDGNTTFRIPYQCYDGNDEVNEHSLNNPYAFDIFIDYDNDTLMPEKIDSIDDYIKQSLSSADAYTVSVLPSTKDYIYATATLEHKKAQDNTILYVICGVSIVFIICAVGVIYYKKAKVKDVVIDEEKTNI